MISRRKLLTWTLGLGAASLLAPAYGMLESYWRPRITRYDLQPARWPAGLDLTVAVIADIHACRPWMPPERIGSIVETTNGLGADIVLLLGDYVVSDRFERHFGTGDVAPQEWAEALSALRAPLGVHSILGNHEWWSDPVVQENWKGPPAARAFIERAGIPVYENDAVRLTKNGKPFWLAGLGDQVAFLPSRWRFPGRPYGTDDLPGTLAKITDDTPIILMAHEPDIAVKVPERVSLMLSGHTHGGQVRLFGYSPVVPSRYGNRFAYGHIREQCDVIVSGGLGCSILPLRIGVPPEIVVVTLRGGGATG
ncbi:MAG: metallophosphoesterase [Xanthobacteraceae bacterium]